MAARKIKLVNRSPVKFLIFASLVFFGFLLGANANSFRNFRFSQGVELSAEDKLEPSELRERLKSQDFLLVNVHTPYEGEIRNTDVFIEYDSMKASASLLPQDKNAPIVLYCKTGAMSKTALLTLKSMGYTNVSHLEGGMVAWERAGGETIDLSGLPARVLPAEGYTLPISWGDLGPKLVAFGVIDPDKFESTTRPSEAQSAILRQGSDDNIVINSQNSQFVVNMLWALGLAQRSVVYERGPMGKEYAAEAGNFASTGGWTLSSGNAMDHYNRHDIVPLTAEQHDRVMAMAEHVFRPCCGNHTAFPDCNHGMAALAAIELMVQAGIPEDEIYENILKLNAFWFPQNYITVATYFERRGTSWEDTHAKTVLGSDFSSGQGAANIANAVGPLPYGDVTGGSCGV